MGALVQGEARRPELVGEAVYGLCELKRSASVAPACCSQRAAIRRPPSWASCHWSKPAQSTLDHLIADAKSGVAAPPQGRMHLSFSEAADNFMAYNVPATAIARDMPGIGAGGRARGRSGVHRPSHASDPRNPRHLVRAGDPGNRFQPLFEKRYAGEPFVESCRPAALPRRGP